MAKGELFFCSLSGLSAWTYDYRNKPEEPYCAWQNYLLAIKGGDTTLADKLKRAILAKPSRDPMYLYLSRKLSPDGKSKTLVRAEAK